MACWEKISIAEALFVLCVRHVEFASLVPGPLLGGAVGVAGDRLRPHLAHALLRGARVALRAAGVDARDGSGGGGGPVLRRRRRLLPLQRLLVHLRRLLHARLQHICERK